MVRDAGAAVSVKSELTTSSVAVAVRVSAPDVPVTVSGQLLDVVPGAVVTVSVDVLPLPVTVDGVKVAVAPGGRPETSSPTEPAKPLMRDTAIA